MKTKKSARKFAASGKLKQAIQARHKQREIRKKIQGRKRGKGKVKGSAKETQENDEDVESDVSMQEEQAQNVSSVLRPNSLTNAP